LPTLSWILVLAVSVHTDVSTAAELSFNVTVATRPSKITPEIEYEPPTVHDMLQFAAFVTVALLIVSLKVAETEAGTEPLVPVAGENTTVGACESIV